MSQSQDFTQLIARQNVAKPQCFVLFGATGDLAKRKIFPALFALFLDKKLPSRFCIVGLGRKPNTDQEFRKYVEDRLIEFARLKGDSKSRKEFVDKIFYLALDVDGDYSPLKKLLTEKEASSGTQENRTFYLAVAPSYFTVVPQKLKEVGLLHEKGSASFANIIIEKPFGTDLASALALDVELKKILFEEQIYRIDHYLGKETVQNIFAFRFSNHFIDHLFTSEFVESVQIVAAEDLVVGDRVEFYDSVGCLRDFCQNHLMQVLAFIAMEAPSKNEAEFIHQEKSKVLRSINKIDTIVRSQYEKGFINTDAVHGYRDDERVKTSNTDTFVGMRLFVDNFRWGGTPFYLFAGKALPRKYTEVNIVLKKAPFSLFPQSSQQNIISIQIQPKEGISIIIRTKVPAKTSLKPVKLDFYYDDYFSSESIPEAYETLIFNAMSEDRSLFTDRDELIASWELYEPIIQEWKKEPLKAEEFYPAGSWPEIMKKVFLEGHYLVI
ncbi:glucose-6-phosphate dehydrogenase [bacterium]|nr:glucose-6-phosphate dehydrogenase [bacterium]